MSLFTNPSNRSAEGFYSMSSCADKSKLTKEEGPFDFNGSIVEFFTDTAYVNIPIATALLMRDHGVQVCCSRVILNEQDGYWKGGPVDHDGLTMVSSMMIYSVGFIEQILCAGVAFLYEHGARDTPIDDQGNQAGPPGTYVEYVGRNNMIAYFHFEGRLVAISIAERSLWGDGLTITLCAGSCVSACARREFFL